VDKSRCAQTSLDIHVNNKKKESSSTIDARSREFFYVYLMMQKLKMTNWAQHEIM